MRLSVSLPSDLVAFVRGRAKDEGLPVSKVVARALRAVEREDRNRRISAALIEDAAKDLQTLREWGG